MAQIKSFLLQSLLKTLGYNVALNAQPRMPSILQIEPSKVGLLVFLLEYWIDFLLSQICSQYEFFSLSVLCILVEEVKGFPMGPRSSQTLTWMRRSKPAKSEY
jgi:hypothetical protein